MRLLYNLRSQIQYKIILPFLLLTLLVALAGSAVSVLFITSTAQERLNNQLAQVARATSDSMVELEQSNLQFLREIAFAGPNPGASAPAVADAYATRDPAILAKAIDPYFVVSTQRQGVRVDRLIAFDTNGNTTLDWETSATGSKRIVHAPRNIQALWFVPAILGKQRDALGDKYSGLLQLGTDGERYLFTVAPVAQGETVVGGLLIGSRVDDVLQQFSQRSYADIVTLYQAEDGAAFASTQVPAAGLAALKVQAKLVPSVRNLEDAQRQSIFDTVTFNQRRYQAAYVPLRVRGDVIALLSVALSSDYVIGPWSNAGLPLMAATVVLMLAIVGLGVLVARQITRPIQELVVVAEAVTSGDMARRSSVNSSDEVGMLSRSFNAMTEHLVDLYDEVQAESSQRAAIVESIADGVVVCNQNGEILVINKAMRAFLDLNTEQAAPIRFNDIPLGTLDEAALAFGEARTPDLFNLGERVVRIGAAPVVTADGLRIGDVFVFQDLTSEVAIDRAKTNFIATISHELRTPLTVLGGSSDLLLRGYVGELNDEQRTLIATMHKHTQSMTSLLNNVITIAGLESGTLEFELGPLVLGTVVENLLWSLRPGFRTKGLQLDVEIADELPEVVADEHQLRNVFIQLLDNARRYTAHGAIRIAAYAEQGCVRVDICDTGPGIDQEVSANLFNRFVRGTQGINSAERGIGLGLAICKMLIERQGGNVWLAESSANGSTFSFTLPSINAERPTNKAAFAEAA